MLKRRIEKKVRLHIKEILSFRRTLTRDDIKEAEKLWLEKEEIFFSTVKHLKMITVPVVKNISSGFLLFTLSGSIIAFAPSSTGFRSLVYFSTGIQGNGKQKRIMDNVKVVSPVRRGKELTLEGELKRTSQIYHLAVFPSDVDMEIQKQTVFSLSGSSDDKGSFQINRG